MLVTIQLDAAECAFLTEVVFDLFKVELYRRTNYGIEAALKQSNCFGNDLEEIARSTLGKLDTLAKINDRIKASLEAARAVQTVQDITDKSKSDRNNMTLDELERTWPSELPVSEKEWERRYEASQARDALIRSAGQG